MEQKNRRAMLGLIFILVGAVLLLDNLYIIPWNISYYLFTWQMLLIVIGIVQLINGNRKGAFIMIGIGVFFWVPDFFRIDFDQYWPVILIIIGIGFFLKGRDHDSLSGKGTSADYLDDLTVFGGNKKTIESNAFEGGKVTTVFGGTDLDITQCELRDGKATLDVFTTFGGFNARVPADWKVVIDVTCIFGGFEDKRSVVQSAESANELTIRGLVIFGGGDIK